MAMLVVMALKELIPSPHLPPPMASLNNKAIVIWDSLRASVINVVGDAS
jgi:hypothetical protein